MHHICVRLSLSVSCVSPPLVPIFGQFLFLSSFVIISSQPCVFSWLVPSPVLLIILFAPSFPSLYKSSVFPVSLSSINVIPGVCVPVSSDLCSVWLLKCFKEVQCILVPGTPCTSVTEYWTQNDSSSSSEVMEFAASVLALSRRDLPFVEFAWEFCGLAAGTEMHDAAILHLFRLGASYHHPMDLPDTTGLCWREGIFRCLGSFRSRVGTSLSSSPLVPFSPLVSPLVPSSPLVSPLVPPSSPSSSALPERPREIALPERPREIALPERPREFALPERRRMPAFPERPPVPAPRLRPPVPAPRLRPPVPAPRLRPPVPAPRLRPPVPAPRQCPPVPAPRQRPPVPAPRQRPPVPAPRKCSSMPPLVPSSSSMPPLVPSSSSERPRESAAPERQRESATPERQRESAAPERQRESAAPERPREPTVSAPAGSPRTPLRPGSPRTPLRPGSPRTPLRPGSPRTPLRPGSPRTLLCSRTPRIPLRSGNPCWSHPALQSPCWSRPALLSPCWPRPALQSPGWLRPALQSPCWFRPALQSPCWLRPALQSPCWFRPALQSPCWLRPTLQSPCRPRPALQSTCWGISPRKFWGGTTRHGLPCSPLRHGLPSPRIHHGHPSSLTRQGLLSPRIRHGPPSPLTRHGRPSSPLRHGSRNGRRPGGLLSCPVSVSLEASRAPTPPSPFDVIRRGTRLLEGGGNVRLSLSVSCVSPPLVPIFGQFLFLSSFVIISSQPCVFSWLVPSPVLLIILFAPSFPSLYKSSVFPVSLSSINVIPGVCVPVSSDLCSVWLLKCFKEVQCILVPGTPCTSVTIWHLREPFKVDFVTVKCVCPFLYIRHCCKYNTIPTAGCQ